MSSAEQTSTLPARFVDLKKEIAESYPDFETRATQAWNEITAELDRVTREIKKEGVNYIPQTTFPSFPEDVSQIKRRGCVVIHGVVDKEQAVKWREELKTFVGRNDVEGVPVEDKQFFQLYWTKPQVQARAHPNVLKVSKWLNALYHDEDKGTTLAPESVDLSAALSYADRFRIRKAGTYWDVHPPHVDGGAIERWEDPAFRKCFEAILKGDWRNHDAYALAGRVAARSSLYGRPNQSTVFRTFQGWMALSATAPNEGTLRVFPDVILANAYIILRPFFRMREGVKEVAAPDADGYADGPIFDPKNWVFDISTPDFPGIYPRDGGFGGPRPTAATHPHMRLGADGNDSMPSVPEVRPGDMVFWHCDVVHAVEKEHKGNEASTVMYIPAVPYTPQNWEYVQRQAACFRNGRQRPPDFPKGAAEGEYEGVADEDDAGLTGSLGRYAMALN